MKTAVVILNWNGKAHLERYLPSVVSHSSDAEIWVADNASTDDSLDFLRENFPTVKITVNDNNHGFAGGYNEALKRIEADLYVLLNSDVEVTANWIEPVVSQFEKDPSVVAAMPKVKAWQRKTHFEHAGAAGGFIDRWSYPFCRGRFFDHAEEDKGQYDTLREVFWATGACMFIRAGEFHNAGGFDNDFFAHMEEIDLCWRLKNQGKKIIMVPDSTVYHLGGGTLNYQSPRKTFLNFRNNLFMIYKNHRGNLFFYMYFRLLLDGIAGAKFLFSGQFSHFWVVIKAHLTFYSQIGKLSRKRKALKQEWKEPNLAGRYTRAIIQAYFLEGKKSFTDLDDSRLL